ncbi:hypothetical protein [Dyadobacter crusticola]|uniref:hypothetical protein n=1 Tax=Dyadobacter crusticola TaxID=292407 RepID=UPI0004E150AC|nr:hypothetical protein [Dyadobacter crusticola]
MKRASQLLGWTIYVLFCTIISARGQPTQGVAKAKEYIDQEVQRHRWEFNVNAGNLFKLGRSGTYQYYYSIKRNSHASTNGKGRAWRFALSPQIGGHKQLYPGDTSTLGQWDRNNYDIKPMFVIGHEWQRSHGRTTLFGGVDFGGLIRLSKGTAYNVISKWDSNVRGRLITKSHTSLVWLSSFLGVKLYLNHRVSVSIESHIQFQYYITGLRTSFEDQFISRNLLIWKGIEPLPCYLINLSYNL